MNLGEFRLARTLQQQAQGERQVEVARQLLVEEPEYDCLKAFTLIDMDRDGKLSPADLKAFLRKHNCYISDEDVFFLARRYRTSGGVLIDYASFAANMTPLRVSSGKWTDTDTTPRVKEPTMGLWGLSPAERLLAHKLKTEVEVERNLRVMKDLLASEEHYSLYEAFKTADTVGRGYLTLDQLRAVMKQYGIFLTFHELEALMRRYDKNRDGLISYAEFIEELMPLRVVVEHTPASGPFSSTVVTTSAPTAQPVSSGLSAPVSARREVLSSPRTPPSRSQPLPSFSSPGNFQSSAYVPTSRAALASPRRFLVRDEEVQTMLASPEPQPQPQPQPQSQSQFGPAASPRRDAASQTPRDVSDATSAAAMPSLDLSALRSEASSTTDSPSLSAVQSHRLSARDPYSSSYLTERFTARTWPMKQGMSAWSPPSASYGASYSAPNTARMSSSPIWRFDANNSKQQVLDKQLTAQLTIVFRKQVEAVREVELLRSKLAILPGFNLIEAFNYLDTSNSGYVTFDDLKKRMEQHGVYVNRLELAAGVKWFDRNRDGKISYAEFIAQLMPLDEEFSALLARRGLTERTYPLSPRVLLSDETQYQLIKSLKRMMEIEHELDYYRIAFSQDSSFNLHQALRLLDPRGVGKLGVTQFRNFLDANQILASDAEVSALLHRYDTQHKGFVSYADFMEQFVLPVTGSLSAR